MEQAKKESQKTAKNKQATGKTSKQKPIRTEFLPEWFDEDPSKKAEPHKEMAKDLEAKKREIEEMLKAFDD
jgi:replication initiation and membrane attachment protein